MTLKRTYADVKKMLLPMLLLFAVVGCSSPKFSGSTTANLTPFADQTVVMLGESDYGFTRDEAIKIQSYLDFSSSDWQRLDELAQKADGLFKAIMRYSTNIVTLSESPKIDPEKALVLAGYLAEFEEQVVRESQMSSEEYQTMLADIRVQEKYLDALKAAEPLLNEVGRYGNALLEEDERVVKRVVDATAAKINAEYQVMLDFKLSVEEQKEAVLRGMLLIRDFYNTGNSQGLQEVVSLLPRLKIHLQGRTPSSSADAFELETLLIEHLKRLKTITEQLEPDFKDWEDAHQELDRIHATVLEDNRRAKLTLIVWGRAYHKMASGVKNPAEWFSLKDILKLGGKTVDKVL